MENSARVLGGYSFSSDDIIELKKHKGVLFASMNSKIKSSLILSKNLSIRIKRYFTKDNIYTGSLGRNPKSSNFKISKHDEFIDGIATLINNGIYIGISDSYIDNENVLSKHWLVKVLIEDSFSLPSGIKNVNGNFVTKYKKYPITLNIDGTIVADGQLSLVSEV